MDSLRIGVDIGGTFTDIVAIYDAGSMWATKVLSTPADFSRGVIDSLAALAEKMGVSLAEIMSTTVEFVNGSTVATNALAEWRGAKVGLIVTEGFRDLLRIARSARTNDFDLHKQRALPELVSRTCIKEVSERVDYKGNIIFKLDETEAERAVRALVEKNGVESVAVVFLWSFRNPQNELRLGELIKNLYPRLHFSLSHQIHPVYREYERMVTTIFNSYVGVSVVRYLTGLKSQLRTLGLPCPVDIMQCSGGRTKIDVAKERPVELVQSGPVAGAMGAVYLGKVLGQGNIILSDMGGTSFDTAVIVNHEIKKRPRVMIGGFLTGLTMVDVVSIGAGGGSIAWIDERGMPRVGPQSTGAQPGPACYGRGGTQPTVTDASVVLGYLNPEYFLGGRMRIYPELAYQAIEGKIATPLGMSLTDAAIGIRELVIASMSNAVRSVTVEKGYDPRNFTIGSYGGMGPLFIADICRQLGIREIIVPAASATFSAYGLLVSEHERNYVKTFHWFDDGEPFDLTETYRELELRAVRDFQSLGVPSHCLAFDWEVDTRFEGQFFEFLMGIPRGDLHSDDVKRMRDQFVKMYEERYGAETAWRDSRMEIVNCRLRAREQKSPPGLGEYPVSPLTLSDCLKAYRPAYISRENTIREVPIYNGQILRPGT